MFKSNPIARALRKPGLRWLRAVAAVAVAKNSVGTPQLKKNAVVSTKVKNGSLRAADFAPGQIPAGPKGETGAAGATGATGAPGMVRGWVEISSTGSVLASGGQSPVANANVTKTGTGTYEITANGWKPSVLLSGSPTGAAALSGGAAGTTTVEQPFQLLFPTVVTVNFTVHTYNAAGAATDRGFTAWIF